MPHLPTTFSCGSRLHIGRQSPPIYINGPNQTAKTIEIEQVIVPRTENSIDMDEQLYYGTLLGKKNTT